MDDFLYYMKVLSDQLVLCITLRHWYKNEAHAKHGSKD